MEQLDRVFGREEEGLCYARYDNPHAAALEELVSALEGGHGALACASGMAAIHMAVLAALTDRRKSIVAANALYGATISHADERARADRAWRYGSSTSAISTPSAQPSPKPSPAA